MVFYVVERAPRREGLILIDGFRQKEVETRHQGIWKSVTHFNLFFGIQTA